jgi:hypothetical protein
MYHVYIIYVQDLGCGISLKLKDRCDYLCTHLFRSCVFLVYVSSIVNTWRLHLFMYFLDEPRDLDLWRTSSCTPKLSAKWAPVYIIEFS